MKERKYIIVNDSTGEVIGDLAPQKTRPSVVPIIILSLLLAASTAFSIYQMNRANEAVSVATGYRMLLEDARSADGDLILAKGFASEYLYLRHKNAWNRRIESEEVLDARLKAIK